MQICLDNVKRLIITLDEEAEDFELETPDGEINLDYLVEVLDQIIHDLSHIDQPELTNDIEETTPTENRLYNPVDKKDLN